MAGEPPPHGRRDQPPTHGQSVSRKTVVEVPLNGVSFEGGCASRCTKGSLVADSKTGGVGQFERLQTFGCVNTFLI